MHILQADLKVRFKKGETGWDRLKATQSKRGTMDLPRELFGSDTTFSLLQLGVTTSRLVSALICNLKVCQTTDVPPDMQLLRSGLLLLRTASR
jgi:hypothetical protein